MNLAKPADAIEAVGISDMLANRLTILEQQREEISEAIKTVRAPVACLPDVVPALILSRRELLLSIESLGDIDAARESLRALLGTVTLKPREGILWTHPTPNTKSLVESRPLDGLRINSPFSGSRGAICTVPAVSKLARLK